MCRYNGPQTTPSISSIAFGGPRDRLCTLSCLCWLGSMQRSLFLADVSSGTLTLFNSPFTTAPFSFHPLQSSLCVHLLIHPHFCHSIRRHPLLLLLLHSPSTHLARPAPQHTKENKTNQRNEEENKSRRNEERRRSGSGNERYSEQCRRRRRRRRGKMEEEYMEGDIHTISSSHTLTHSLIV